MLKYSKANLSLLIVFVATLVIDIVSKFIISREFLLGESKTIIENFFYFTYVLNPGVVFGFMAEIDSSYKRLFFIVTSLIIIAVIIYMIVKEKKYLVRLSLILILSGAFGNLIDRIFVGAVIDFLDFQFFGHGWYIFNIADSSITVGVALMIIDLLFFKGKHNEQS